MGDLLTFLALVLAGAGILDGVTGIRLKRRVAARVRNSISPPAGSPQLSRLFDRFFGAKIFSWRAFSKSVLISLAFNAAAYVAAHLLSGGQINDLIATSFEGSAPEAGAILLVIFLFVLLGDYFSIAQTRVFMRSVERYGSGSVTSVMVIADLLASIFIFVAFFALGRVVGYLIIAQAILPPTITEDKYYIPETVVSSFRMMEAENAVRAYAEKNPDPNGKAKAKFALALVDYDRGVLKLQDLSVAQFNSDFPYGPVGKDFVLVKAEPACSNDPKGQLQSSINLYGAFTHSLLAVTSAVGNTPGGEKMFKKGGDPDVMSEKLYRDILNNPAGKCGTKLVRIKETLDPRKMTAGLSFLDMYLASFFLSASDIFEYVPSKFSDYDLPNLHDEFTSFASWSWFSRSTTILSFKSTDLKYSTMISFLRSLNYSPSSDKVSIPFTTFAASSLGASMLFWMALLGKTVLHAFALFRQKVSDVISLGTYDRWAFSPIALFAISLLLIMFLSVKALGLIWSLFLQVIL